MHLRLGICACINEPFRAHMNTYACLEAREMRDVNFFLNTTFIEMLRIYFFLGYYVMHLLYFFPFFFFFFLGKYSEN